MQTLADALIDVGATRLAEGDDQVRALIERGLALASQSGFDDLVARGYHNLGFGFGEQFQFARAASYFSGGIAFCNVRDLDHPWLFIIAWLAYCRCFQGEWSRAAALASSVPQASDVSLSARFMALLTAAMLRVRRGQPGAKAYLDEALTLAEAWESSYFLCPIHAVHAEAAWLVTLPAVSPGLAPSTTSRSRNSGAGTAACWPTGTAKAAISQSHPRS